MNFFQKEITRTNRNKAILWVSITLLGMYLIYNSIPYVQSVLRGGTPVAITEETLSGSVLTSSVMNDGFHYVQLNGSAMEFTGLEEVTTRYKRGRATRTYTSGYYHILAVGQKAILVRTSDVTKETTVRGVLRPIEDDIKGELPYLESELLEERELAPIYLDTKEYTQLWGYIYFFLVGIGIINLLIVSLYILKPQLHPLTRKAKKTNISTATEYSALNSLTLGLIDATPQYLMYKGWFSTKIVDLDKVLWVHQTSKAIKKFFIITVGHRQHLTIHTDSGHTLDWETSQMQIDAVCAFLAKHRPEITLGDSHEYQERFKTDLGNWKEEVAEARRNRV